MGILGKGFRQHSSVTDSDSLNSQSIKQSPKGRVLGLFYVFLDFIKGLLTKALHLYDFRPMLFQGEKIRELLDKASAQPLFQGHLGKSLDIQSISTGKKSKLLNSLCRTMGIGAI